jgi:hypothetical protein
MMAGCSHPGLVLGFLLGHDAACPSSLLPRHGVHDGDRPRFCCDRQVLAADLTAVHDCMFANEGLLDKLFAFLDREAPLNSLLAGYFSKIVSTLLSRRPDETLKVFENRNVVPQLLKHLGAYAMLDLLLKLVSEADEKESDGGAQLDWLYRCVLSCLSGVASHALALVELKISLCVQCALSGICDREFIWRRATIARLH